MAGTISSAWCNLWPRPIQQPHPPIWIPGAGLSSTAEYVVGLDHCFCHLSYYGAKNAGTVSDRYWELVRGKGRDDNPYRYSFLQLIGVGETDAEAEELYAPHAEYFFHKLLYNPPHYQAIPGCLDYNGMVQALHHNPRAGINLRELKAKDFYDRGFVVAGSPKTVRDQLLEGVKRNRIGHLLTACCISARCRPSCARRISTCSRARCCLPSPPCGTTRTRIAGGPSASGKSVRRPAPPLRWPQHPKSAAEREHGRSRAA